MRSQAVTSGQYEKPAAGWFNGMNGNRMPWLLPDTQYSYAENVLNRGGVIKTRPGYDMAFTLPSGNLQAFILFEADKSGPKTLYVVCAVDGVIYAAPFSVVYHQIIDWGPYKLPLAFSPEAVQLVFCVARKSAGVTSDNLLSIVPSHSILMIQDGISRAAYFDGIAAEHLDENRQASQTPTGLWMFFAGQRLWVSRGNAVVASDIGDPLTFRERLNSAEGTSGDFDFNETVTALSGSNGDSNQSNVIVFTLNQTSSLRSDILDRTKWAETEGFRQVIYANLGCAAGKSPVNHLGLLWWWSSGGLVSSDSAARSFISSQTRYKDVEMARVKREISSDGRFVCLGTFENYLLVSVPYKSDLNSRTMVLDGSGSDELTSESEKSWQGVWTGIRPIEWSSQYIDEVKRIFCASTDYSSVNGSENHVWEAFMPHRWDVWHNVNSDNEITFNRTRIYGSFETKLYGDLIDLKRFDYAEADLIEIENDVALKISFAGQRGPYVQILKSNLIACVDEFLLKTAEALKLFSLVGPFKPQSRRVKTSRSSNLEQIKTVESEYIIGVDKAFSLRFEWCGSMAIESFRIFINPFVEPSSASCSVDEAGEIIVTPDGKSFKF